MARITVEDCLEEIGDDNRFNLIKLTVNRIKQHRRGEPFLAEGKNKEVVMTLREIAAGTVTFGNIEELPGMNEQENEGDEEAVEKKEVTVSA